MENFIVVRCFSSLQIRLQQDHIYKRDILKVTMSSGLQEHQIPVYPLLEVKSESNLNWVPFSDWRCLIIL